MNKFTIAPNLFLSALKSFLLAAALLVHGMSALAQRTPGQWVGDLYLIYNPMGSAPIYLVDENNVIKQEIPVITNITDFPIPPELRTRSMYARWHDGGLFMYAYGNNEKDKDGIVFSRRTFAKWQDGEWHYLGSYKGDIRGSTDIIPCDNDRFIAVSTKDLSGNISASRTPFARMSLNSATKDVRVESTIDHGQDGLRQFMSDDVYFNYAFLSKFKIITDKHATIINDKTGMFWVFSLEKATLVKAGNIFKKVTPEMIAKGGFHEAVLAANPEKDGTVLISTQMEEAFTTEMDPVQEINELARIHNVLSPGATMTPNEIFDIFDKRLKELAERNPNIVWYRIYPENGKVEQLSLPPEGCAIDRDGGKNDGWQPMANGTVKMGPVRVKQQEEKPKPEKQEDKAPD